MAKELSNAVYAKSGIRDAFHILSHHSNLRENMDKFAVLNRYHVTVFTYLLEKLKTHARRRRQPARSFHRSLRQRDERRQSAQSRAAADRAGGRRFGQAEGRPAHPESEGHHDVESAAGDSRKTGSPAGILRRQHWSDGDLSPQYYWHNRSRDSRWSESGSSDVAFLCASRLLKNSIHATVGAVYDRPF